MRKALLILLAAALSLGAMTEKPKSGGIQYVIRVIEASSDASAPNDAADVVPPDLKEILRHTAYTQVGVVILRGFETDFTLGDVRGAIDSKLVDHQGQQVIEFELELVAKRKNEEGEEDWDWGEPIIETSDIARDGETVVLGASSMRGGGKATIVLMTPTIIR